ncbi:disease resistance protein RGA2-like [Vicia villosa]|uniref:disease resistance protein RGA2-like n=1 Tax=Vicia villosa TaxID=3911 RepID=UPI00273CAAB5|nr:disease resistance protein RGA2-like [Vicia villosa]
MAESFVFDIADSLLGKLASYICEEAAQAYGVYEDLQGIKDTLSIVRGLLLDAEDKKDHKHGLREWLRQLHNICSDAEDVLDGFELQHKKKQVVEASGSTKMKVRHFFSSSNPVVFRPKMAHLLKRIRDRLYKVASDGNKFGLATISIDHGLVVPRRETTHSYIDALDVIGRENDREEIIKLLMQPHPRGDGDGDQSLCVIPIVGIGGLGKTTLAKLVFNDKRMDELFQLKIWVCVSNDFDIRQLIIKVINSAYASASVPTAAAIAPQENINNFDIEQLQIRLRYKLSRQKFLLVLDDIWNEDRAEWIKFKDLIKVGAPGSKIIATTRSSSIASMMSTLPSYVLGGLSQENCLSLFVKWAFKDGEEEKYPNLVEIGKEVVKKCKGVPLAVTTLGSSLFSKYDLNKWRFVRDSELWNLKQNKNEILPALKLSYDQMPFNLRHCFTYFSLYPKDFGFTSVQITKLWVALGLIQSQDGNQSLESIARDYIDELHSRSFLQDFEDFGHFYYFKVHDLVHDLALYVAKDECVAVDSHTRNISQQVRHFSIVDNGSLDSALFPKSKSVRTVLFPIGGVGLESESMLDTWISRYKYLRILDLSDSSFHKLPDSISKLEHLCVLNLSNNCKITRLPYSICKLQSLQVLSLSGCLKLEKLPTELGKLINLRQLYITTKQSVIPHNIFANLTNLQTLSFEYCDSLEFLFNGVQFTSLETLIVRCCGRLKSLPFYILPKLEALLVIGCENLDLSLSENHTLENPMERWRMTFLYLENECLWTLPEWIEGVVETLQTLIIINLPMLQRLPECLARMAHLKMLYIAECIVLAHFPVGIKHLTSLVALTIHNCPILGGECHPHSGQYWPVISHIKRVSIGLGTS